MLKRAKWQNLSVCSPVGRALQGCRGMSGESQLNAAKGQSSTGMHQSRLWQWADDPQEEPWCDNEECPTGAWLGARMRVSKQGSRRTAWQILVAAQCSATAVIWHTFPCSSAAGAGFSVPAIQIKTWNDTALWASPAHSMCSLDGGRSPLGVEPATRAGPKGWLSRSPREPARVCCL